MPSAAPPFIAQCRLDAERWNSKLPKSITALGVATFGSLAQLQEVVRSTQRPKTIVSSASGRRTVCAHLVQLKGDNSIGRLGPDILKPTLEGPYGVRQVTEQGGVILDVGANVGAFTVIAAQLHPTLQIVSLEPTPTTYFFLRWNLWLNRIRLLSRSRLGVPDAYGVLPINAAVTADGANVTLQYNPQSSQDALVGAGNADTRRSWRSVTVSSFTLPDFVRAHQLAVRLVKLDCEGCEFAALAEAPDFFARVPRLGAEIHSNHWSVNTLAQPAVVTRALQVIFELRRPCATKYGNPAWRTNYIVC